MKMPPRKVLMPGKKEVTKEDPVYKEKRNKNNDAVKKSRQKTKVKSEETMQKVAILNQVSNTTVDLKMFNRNFLAGGGGLSCD